MARFVAGRRLPMMLLIVALMALSSVTTAAAQGAPVPPWRVTLASPPAEATITVGTTPLTVQLAVTPAQQTLGLGSRNGLAPGTGMLFIFDAPASQTFWMKGMRFCLDIVWVTETEIAGAAEGACPDPPGTADADRQVYASTGAVRYVLEVPAGWLAAHGYGAGTPVDLTHLPATLSAAATLPR